LKDCRIVIVDDEEIILDSVRDYFDQYAIVTHSDPRAALEYMRGTRSDILICDYRMPHLSGLDVLREARRMNAYRFGILLTAYADKELLLHGIQEELVDRVVEKPLRLEVLENALRDAVVACRINEVERIELAEVRELYRKSVKGNTALCREIMGLEGGLAGVYGTIIRVSGAREAVLITGETGTGKEVAARLIHTLSGYGSGLFIKINCGAIPETLIESELFGHVKGAFSGAEADKAGKIELAEGGTLFLDEVGELRDVMQTRFLQVLQDRTVERIGSNRQTRVDFRLIAATNRDLDADVASGRFRRDLFYRIDTVRLSLPPLRDRKEDIPALARSFLDAYCAEMGRPRLGISKDALERLVAHPWPGNVRELENAVKRAVILMDPREPTVTAAFFDFLTGGEVRERHAGGGRSSLDELAALLGGAVLAEGLTLDQIEGKLLDNLIQRHAGNVLETSRRTGISKDRLYRRLAKGRGDGTGR
jgi:two-component system response regulator AtoC